MFVHNPAKMNDCNPALHFPKLLNVRDLGGHPTVDGRLTHRRSLLRSDDLAQLTAESRRTRRLLAGGLLGSTLLIAAALIAALAPGRGWLPPAALACGGALAWLIAWPRRSR